MLLFCGLQPVCPFVLWPLTSAKHFPLHSYWSLDIFSVNPREGWASEGSQWISGLKMLHPAHLASTTTATFKVTLLPVLSSSDACFECEQVVFNFIFQMHWVAAMGHGTTNSLHTAKQVSKQQIKTFSKTSVELMVIRRSFTFERQAKSH